MPIVDDDAQKEFQTHLFFLRHFTKLVHEAHGNPESLEVLIVRLLASQAPNLTAIQQTSLADAERQQLRKYLFAAWNGEAVSQLSAVHPAEVRRFTNQWKPIQGYYAIYFQLVALQFVLSKSVMGTHAQMLKYGTYLTVPKLPVPWRLRLHYDKLTPEYFPAAVNLQPGWGWNLANIDSYEYMANFLRVTGERKQHEVWTREYKGNKKKLIPSGPRQGKRYRIRDVPVGYVSAFDVLWRLRTWANYREADTIIAGGEYEGWALEFDDLFNVIVETTGTVLEHMICRRVGPKVLHGLYQDYLSHTKGALGCPGIQRRRNIICAGVAM